MGVGASFLKTVSAPDAKSVSQKWQGGGGNGELSRILKALTNW